MKRLLEAAFCAAAAVLVAVVAVGQPFPATSNPQQGVTTVMSGGTITTGGTFQAALAANTNRRACIINNNSATSTDFIYVYLGPTASATQATSMKLAVGASFNCSISPHFVATDNIAVTGTTTGDSYTIAYQ